MIPLISICIPTYNRASFLKDTLDSFVQEPVFLSTEKVEIIISDNCSEDNTAEIVFPYIQKFPQKIKYFKNKTNLKDKNFELALSRGTGVFLKLHNDNLAIKKGILDSMVSFVEKNSKEQPILFFLNGNTKEKEEVTNCSSVDQTISHISYFSTWIAGFGIWKTDFEQLGDFSKYATKNLAQTEVFSRLLLKKKKAVVFNRVFLATGNQVYKKSGYNVAEVFSKNYLSILKNMIVPDGLSQKVYEAEKKKVFLEYTFKSYFDFERLHRFDKGHYWEYTVDYHKNLYYYLLFLKWFYKKLLPYPLIWKLKVLIYTYLIKNEQKRKKYERKLV